MSDNVDEFFIKPCKSACTDLYPDDAFAAGFCEASCIAFVPITPIAPNGIVAATEVLIENSDKITQNIFKPLKEAFESWIILLTFTFILIFVFIVSVILSVLLVRGDINLLTFLILIFVSLFFIAIIIISFLFVSRDIFNAKSTEFSNELNTRLAELKPIFTDAIRAWQTTVFEGSGVLGSTYPNYPIAKTAPFG